MKWSIYSLLLIASLFVSCKKDKIVPVLDEDLACDCTPIPVIDGPNTGYNYELDSIYFLFPQFNPNDDNEILFCKHNQVNNGHIDMFRYNLVTQQKTLLYSGTMFYAPSWGKKDWILFDQGDGQIWKMKSDGSNIALVTSGGAYFHPEWNEEGTEFMAFRGFVNTSDYYNGKIWSLEGVMLDSVDILPIAGDWKHQSNFGSLGSGNLIVVNPETKEVVNTIEGSYNLGYFSFDWISSNIGLLASNEGIFRVNIATSQREQLLSSCNSRIYTQATTNGNGSKIIYTEIVKTPINANTLRVTKNLVLMNTDGSGFSRLNIPM